MNSQDRPAPEFAPPKDAGLFGFDLDLDRNQVIIIGVPWEPTVSYGRGTSATPAAIIAASHQLDLYDAKLERDFGCETGMLPLNEEWTALNQRCIALADPILAEGGRLTTTTAASLEQVNQAGSALNFQLATLCRDLIARDKIVGILGGDHSSPEGAIKAHLEHYPNLGILHIDAHHDLRAAYEGFTHSHASIMYNLLKDPHPPERLVSVGIRDFSSEEAAMANTHPAIRTFYDRDLQAERFRGSSWQDICYRIVAELPETVYVSFDIDGLDPKLCPHTGTPVPGGLNFAQATFLLETLIDCGRRIVGFDLCEVSPSPSSSNGWDLNVGARILHKLCALAHLSRYG